jgi:uncharacterized protein
MYTLTAKDWLFIIPIPGENLFLFYAPLHGIATKVTETAMKQLKGILEAVEKGLPLDSFSEYAVNYLTEKELLVFPPYALNEHNVIPGSQGITLSLTNDCNLRCIYCYANAGVDTTTMPDIVAFTAIAYAIDLTHKMDKKTFWLTFHGGGESLIRKGLFKRCVEKAIELTSGLGMDLHVHVVTNATLITDSFAFWMATHKVKDITVSLDGSVNIQDLQRPMKNGKGSSELAMRGIGYLKKHNIPFAIRATVTSKSVAEMASFVNFLATNVFGEQGGVVHFEPLSLCGRAHRAKELDVEPSTYVTCYKEARLVGEILNIKVTCTLDTFMKDKLFYCGTGTGNMFCVCPNGKISGCSRVTKPEDPGAELFFYGEFNGSIDTPVIYPDARQQILAHGGLPKEMCSGCFARWNCQGFCPIARYLGEDTFSESCAMVKKLLLEDMLEKL